MPSESKNQKRERQRRYALHWSQCGLCPVCRQPLANPSYARRALDPRAPEYPTIHHIIPRAKRGANRSANLMLTHRACNELLDDQWPPMRLVIIGALCNFARTLKQECEAAS